MNNTADDMTVSRLLERYRNGETTARRVMADLLERIEADGESHVWIHRCHATDLEPFLTRLESVSPADLPLYGVPFAIKDNIDLAGAPTTAGCPAYAYVPVDSAEVVQKLIEAGAVPLGKTNLDQFATGLVGTRSPYGTPGNAFDADYIPGGSSSGSAVAVARGHVPFALGTDTAGSGRVPAAFNNLVGLKPTRGLISTRGVVPACRSLDCVSIFALCCADAQRVLAAAAGFDESDPFSRRVNQMAEAAFEPSPGFRCGVPRADQLEFFGNDSARRLFELAAERLHSLGMRIVEVDFQPFLDVARLLYEGPWVAERYAAIREFIEAQPHELHPVTRDIIAAGARPSAVSAFEASYRLAALRRASEKAWAEVDIMACPTAGTIYRIDEVESDPVRLNSNLGRYTNFMNLLDLAAVAVPAGFLDSWLPFGVTLFAPAGTDEGLLRCADRFHRDQDLILGLGPTRSVATPELTEECDPARIQLAVCGAHLRGMPLNGQLRELGATFVRATRTAPVYRFYALAGTTPAKPGMIRDERGAGIEIEIWSLRPEAFGRFVAAVPRPLCIGQVETEDGDWVSGFLCEPAGLEGAQEITDLRGWRAYVGS